VEVWPLVRVPVPRLLEQSRQLCAKTGDDKLASLQ
jgi:hypothetical protein